MPGWRKSFTSCLQKLHDEGKQVFCFNVRDNLYTYVGIAMGWIDRSAGALLCACILTETGSASCDDTRCVVGVGFPILAGICFFSFSLLTL